MHENKITVDDLPDSDINYTLSGKIDFIWRATSNGAVYMFEVGTYYYDDHTEGHIISIITAPIYFSDDCFCYTTYRNGVPGNSIFYALEGSDLEKALAD